MKTVLKIFALAAVAAGLSGCAVYPAAPGPVAYYPAPYYGPTVGIYGGGYYHGYYGRGYRRW